MIKMLKIDFSFFLLLIYSFVIMQVVNNIYFEITLSILSIIMLVLKIYFLVKNEKQKSNNFNNYNNNFDTEKDD